MSSWKENVSGFYNAEKAASWGMVTFDWSIGFDQWRQTLPHPGEAWLLEQCRLVKALGTGTRCLVYRQNSLSLQWQASSRQVQTAANSSMFLKFATQALCDAAPPCAVAWRHSAPTANFFCCNFSRVYNEPLAPRVDPESRRGERPAVLGLPSPGGGGLLQVRLEVAEQVALGATANDAVDGIFVPYSKQTFVKLSPRRNPRNVRNGRTNVHS